MKQLLPQSIYDYKDAYFDFEVLPEYICVTFFLVDQKTFKDHNDIKKHVFIFDQDDPTFLLESLLKFKNFIYSTSNDHIFLAWNVNYDKRILCKIFEILDEIKGQDFDAKQFFKTVFDHSVRIVTDPDINKEYPVFKFKILFYDVMNYRLPVSLKVASGELGFNIQESSIAWDQTHLTNEQKQELLDYNFNDVDILFRINQKYYPFYNIRKGLVDEFSNNDLNAIEYKNNYFHNKIYKLNLPSSFYQKEMFKDEYEPSLNFLETGSYDFMKSIKDNQRVMYILDTFFNNPTIKLSPEVINVFNYFKNTPITYSTSKFEPLEFDYLGMKVNVALGGIHGSKDGFISEQTAFMDDITSMYPNGIINFNFYPRTIINDPIKKNILPDQLNQRVIFKHSDDPLLKQKDLPYKILINSFYGVTRAKFSKLFDPVNGTNLCIVGQLCLLVLCDLIKPYITDMIQINTDGINYIPKPDCIDKINEQIKFWSSITGWNIERTIFKKTFNFNVNNYIMLTEDDHLKVKGKYINQSGLDLFKQSANNMIFDNGIVGLMCINYFLYQKPFEQTIQENQELYKYCTIKKIQKPYDQLRQINEDQSIPLTSINPQYPLRSSWLNKNQELNDYELIPTKINRFIAVKNGHLFLKYASKKEINTETWINYIPDFDANKIDQDDPCIYHDEKVDYVFNDELKTLYTYKLNANGSTYSISYKNYMGEKMADMGSSSIIYNQPLYTDYQNNYQLNTSNCLTIPESGLDIDYDWYIKKCYDLINVWSVYEDFVKLYPQCKIEQFEKYLLETKPKKEKVNELVDANDFNNIYFN